MLHRGVRVVGLLAVLVGGLLTTAASGGASAAASDDGSYVALGDSYSSGVGTRNYIDDGTECQRSMASFPALTATARGYQLNLRACSGAKVSDVADAQLSALNDSVDYVTLSVGGNDANFAGVLTECAQPAWSSDCNGAIDDAQKYIRGTLGGTLDGLYRQVDAQAPDASVVIVGYPRIFMGEDCNAFTWFSPEEQARLNETADQLNAVLAGRARAAGFEFVDPTSRFIGRAVCDDPEWINGLSNPVSESYHPNAAGHRDGYTPMVSRQLVGTRVSANPKLTRQSAQAAPSQAALQRQYASRDSAIDPERFEAPDLNSPQVRAAAKRHGIDVSDRAEVERADRLHSRRQASAYR